MSKRDGNRRSLPSCDRPGPLLHAVSLGIYCAAPTGFKPLGLHFVSLIESELWSCSFCFLPRARLDTGGCSRLAGHWRAACFVEKRQPGSQGLCDVWLEELRRFVALASFPGARGTPRRFTLQSSDDCVVIVYFLLALGMMPWARSRLAIVAGRDDEVCQRSRFYTTTGDTRE